MAIFPGHHGYDAEDDGDGDGEHVLLIGKGEFVFNISDNFVLFFRQFAD